ncbi:unnamed protein product [Cuscuta europaea]|uniref:Uncharacterized protein n=1 Tax=Cuscuta europaea TaxID=41803 RepID=A0A9P0ZET3_CUSEU|nr:unnamed protein product [Cuscuta europaea]
MTEYLVRAACAFSTRALALPPGTAGRLPLSEYPAHVHTRFVMPLDRQANLSLEACKINWPPCISLPDGEDVGACWRIKQAERIKQSPPQMGSLLTNKRTHVK